MSPDRRHRARPPRLRADEQDGGGLCRQERWPLHLSVFRIIHYFCYFQTHLQNNTLLHYFCYFQTHPHPTV